MAKDPSKTEKATPKRKEDARRKGQVAISKEVSTAAVLLTSLLVFYFAGSYMLNCTLVNMHKYFYESGSFDFNPSTAQTLLIDGISTFSKILAPLLLAILVAGVASCIIQIGFLFSLEPLSLKLNKLNPVKGITKMFSKRSLIELPKSVIKLIIVAFIAFITIKQEISNVFLLTDRNPSEILSYIGIISLKILLRTIWALIALAILDYIFQRHEYEEELKMTKEEVKDELRQREGDPQVKKKIRSIQYQMARRRMMESISKADVVVTNPTHLAVALEYNKERMIAPTVVAKGAGFIAEKIKEIARKNGIPIVENKPLAKTLYKLVDIGEIIPLSLYKAVAEVLAFVYQLKKKRFGEQRDIG